MDKWKLYWKLQLKRFLKALPGMSWLTVLLTVSLLLLLKAMFFIEEAKEEKQVARIGIVGDLSDSYLGIGIQVLMNMENIKSMADFQILTEEEAKLRFEAGEISAYLLVPEGFIDSILTGENKKISYVTTQETQGIVGMLVNELVGAISGLVTTTQTNVYAMQTYLIENDMREQLAEATKGINLAFIGAALNRKDIYELQLLGVSNKLSVTGHLFTGILMLLVLLWGMNCVSLMVREEDSLLKILRIKGLSAGMQVTAEVAAYAMLQCMSLCVVFCCVILAKSVLGLEIPEWESKGAIQSICFIGKWIPVVIMIVAMQAFLYEVVSNVMNGVLLQFSVAISMGYLSGCIYPISFFPKIVQQVAGWSPVGVALKFVQKSLTGQYIVIELLLIVLYTGLFVSLHIWRRRVRITGE